MLVLTVAQALSVEDVDFYALEFEWKPAFCFGRTLCPASFKTDDFNIHALIPYNKSNKEVLRCSNEPFKLESETEMRQWQPRDERLTPEQHWSIEWKKHGTCMKTKHTPQQYFDRTLALAKRFNVKGMLAEKGIVPDKEKIYTKESVQNALGYKIGLDCSPIRGYLKYLQIYLDLDFNPIDAPKDYDEDPCPATFQFPTFGDAPRTDL